MPPVSQEPSGRQGGAGRRQTGGGLAARGSLLATSALIASLLVVFVAYASVVTGDAPERRHETRPSSPADSVRLSGHVVGLYPGGARPFRVRVENTGRRPLIVLSVKAFVKNPSASCSAWNVSVRPYRGHLRLPQRARRWVRLTIAMRADAANACQRATFPLVYRARVRAVR
jgi:hypothetical protein